MRVEWSEHALESLALIVSYLAERNPQAAQQIHADIMASAGVLSQFPYMHRLGRVPGTREALVTASYLLVYRVTNSVDILEVLHTRREYP